MKTKLLAVLALGCFVAAGAWLQASRPRRSVEAGRGGDLAAAGRDVRRIGLVHQRRGLRQPGDGDRASRGERRELHLGRLEVFASTQ